MRFQGICPVSERKEEKLTFKQKKVESIANFKILTLKDVIDLYLTEVIENRVIVDQRTGVKRIINGTRNLKGRQKTRRML
ncbi:MULTISPECIES: hypothetical protein [Acinetobacter]|uniref:hypothetical protein n=1 Tax=Acinetobacter TaxID=469 RepID=UPI0009D69334|nr:MULTISPECIES: hypothetical protein [Acinetobacter]MBA5698177.1 hypothetical protein [Acinetobacter radioresistens]MBA5700413.1 hypothetical protein [Acinetobacter radioresistens]MCK4076891.1 hypothetical protein [Acinetobacter radioresistens]MCK4083085.1 hypothetical protein [Acinetobacter radioresistens]MCK4092870.1 hypothetical protein [Acinetobacter radioresistens]